MSETSKPETQTSVTVDAERAIEHPATETASKDRGRKKPRWPLLYFLGECVVLLGLGCSLVALLGFFGGSTAIDLFSHFRVQYAVLLIPAILAAILVRAWRCLSVISVAWLANLIAIAPLWIAPAQPTGGGPMLTVLQLNVLTSNRNHQAVIDLIDTTEPDVVVLEEVDHLWMDAVRQIPGFEVTNEVTRTDNFGLAILARDHLTVLDSAQHEDSLGLPILETQLELAGQPIRIIGSHPIPPMGRGRTRARDQNLEQTANLITEKPTRMPVVVAGDLNATCWSRGFRRFVSSTGLRDSTRGFGPQGSWPQSRLESRIPTGGIGIDHILVSEHWRVEERYIGPDIGSDHRPVIATLVLAESLP